MTGVQTCALPICSGRGGDSSMVPWSGGDFAVQVVLLQLIKRSPAILQGYGRWGGDGREVAEAVTEGDKERLSNIGSILGKGELEPVPWDLR